jgi:hypothetical protein
MTFVSRRCALGSYNYQATLRVWCTFWPPDKSLEPEDEALYLWVAEWDLHY